MVHGLYFGRNAACCAIDQTKKKRDVVIFLNYFALFFYKAIKSLKPDTSMEDKKSYNISGMKRIERWI